MDGHSIKLFSRKEMKASYLSKDKTYGKAIRTFYTQDQASKKPLFAKVAYSGATVTFYTQDQSSKKPLFAKAAYSGATVAQVTPQLVEANKEILGGPFLTVNDNLPHCERQRVVHRQPSGSTRQDSRHPGIAPTQTYGQTD